MKAILLTILSLCLALSVFARSQNTPNQASRSQAAAGARMTTIMGTIIQEDSGKLRFVTDQRAWNVDNPATLKGQEGHYVHVKAHVYPDKDSIHIIEVKMPTASETQKNDMKQAR